MTKKDGSIRSDIYRIIRIGYTGDVASRAFDIVIAVSILLNLFIIFFETFDASVRYLKVLSAIELVTVIIFTVEYILRLITADYLYPSKKTFGAAILAFVISLYGIVDLLSFAPYWIACVFPAASIPGGVVAFRMIRVVRILRLFRINRYYDAFNVITDVLKDKKNQIVSALFIILMLVMASSIIMYDLEHAAQPDQFKNAFSGIWWAVSTLLTVGYGDIYPMTAAGRFVGIILAFLGVGIVAIPTGIISAGFVQQYTKIRDLAGTSEEYPIGFICVDVDATHEWAGAKACSIKLIKGTMIPVIVRGNETIIPDGDTIIREGDRVVITSDTNADDLSLEEIALRDDSEWSGASVSALALALNVTCVLVKRDGDTFVPDKDTVIKGNDTVTVFRRGIGGRM